jgi:hypothetical protein
MLFKKIIHVYYDNQNRDSSVGIVWAKSFTAIVQFPAGDSSLLHSVQTGTGAHTATMGTGVPFPEVKRPQRESDHSSLSNAEVMNCGAKTPLSHTPS